MLDLLLLWDLLLFLLEKTVLLKMVKMFAPGKEFNKVSVFQQSSKLIAKISFPKMHSETGIIQEW